MSYNRKKRRCGKIRKGLKGTVVTYRLTIVTVTVGAILNIEKRYLIDCFELLIVLMIRFVTNIYRPIILSVWLYYIVCMIKNSIACSEKCSTFNLEPQEYCDKAANDAIIAIAIGGFVAKGGSNIFRNETDSSTQKVMRIVELTLVSLLAGLFLLLVVCLLKDTLLKGIVNVVWLAWNESRSIKEAVETRKI